MGGCHHLSCVCDVVLPQRARASAVKNDVSPAVMTAGASQKQTRARKTMEIQNSSTTGEDYAHLSHI